MARLRPSRYPTGSTEDGFTLIELLLVIVILGVLAAVVTFSVTGIADTGQGSACKADKSTITTAEEAARANREVGGYVSVQDLHTLGLLTDVSEMHQADFPPGATPTAKTVGAGTVGVYPVAPQIVPVHDAGGNPTGPC